MKDNTIGVFFTLLRVGLWADTTVHDSWLMDHGSEQVDWDEVYQLAEVQSVVGLVLAGIEHSNIKPHQELLLQWIGEVQILEQQNKAMNHIVGDLVQRMRQTDDIYTLLVKGQGIAQCYEKPLWRASGDIDFYLSDTNFAKAKKFFRPLVDSVDPDNDSAQHINMQYGEWVVEIHANQHCSLSTRVNRVLDEIHHDLFYNGNIRSWANGRTQVFLPSPDDDVIIVFTHLLNHFYCGGVGVRQICDWCRLLWTYRKELNYELLESRIHKTGLVNVWKAFAAFAVDYLGMPEEAMPIYSSDKKWKRKADRICSFILEVGNFGHNRDTSYYEKYPRMIRKAVSMGRRLGDLFRHARLFPIETLRFIPGTLVYGVVAVVKGN